jgi:hypothetical protein
MILRIQAMGHCVRTLPMQRVFERVLTNRWYVLCAFYNCTRCVNVFRRTLTR